jgi:hypothetical protein
MYGLLLAGCDDYAVSEDGKAYVLLDIPLFGNAFMRMPVIVTFNLIDFPPDVLAGHNFESRHPDEFLASRFDAEPGPVHRAVRRQREKLKHRLVYRFNEVSANRIPRAVMHGVRKMLVTSARKRLETTLASTSTLGSEVAPSTFAVASTYLNIYSTLGNPVSSQYSNSTKCRPCDAV